MKPIYAGTHQVRGRGRGKVIFTIIVLLQLAAVGVYFYMKSDKPEAGENPPAPVPEGLAPTPAPAALLPARKGSKQSSNLAERTKSRGKPLLAAAKSRSATS